MVAYLSPDCKLSPCRQPEMKRIELRKVAFVREDVSQVSSRKRTSEELAYSEMFFQKDATIAPYKR